MDLPFIAIGTKITYISNFQRKMFLRRKMPLLQLVIFLKESFFKHTCKRFYTVRDKVGLGFSLALRFVICLVLIDHCQNNRTSSKPIIHTHVDVQLVFANPNIRSFCMNFQLCGKKFFSLLQLDRVSILRQKQIRSDQFSFRI